MSRERENVLSSVELIFFFCERYEASLEILLEDVEAWWKVQKVMDELRGETEETEETEKANNDRLRFESVMAFRKGEG